MVDAVITWVDGSDPAHREKRERWLAKLEGRQARPRPGTSDTRWESRFELYYCIRLIRQNAPWIQRIFLVTDEQRPEWLTEEEVQRYGVVLVDHKVLFAGHEHVLPTFNSTAIETMLHRIPGLSGRYLYFNDDVFLLRPTRERDYFYGERGRWRGQFQKRYTVKKLVQFLRWVTRTPKPDGYVGVRKEKAILRRKRLFVTAHAPHPFAQGVTRDLIECEGRMENNIADRFRRWDSFRVPMLVANSTLINGQARRGPNDWEYIHAQHSEEEIRRRIDRCRRDRRIKSLCVQSLDMMPDHLQGEIEALLRSFLRTA